MRSYVTIIIGLSLLPPLAAAIPKQAGTVDLRADAAPPRADLLRVVENQKKNDVALDLFERIERVEVRRSNSDSQPPEVKISRVIPAGTGTGHIPLGPDGKPTDAAAYRAALEKLADSLSFAAADGRAQHDAYEKIAKKHKDRDELIEATRTAFIFTFVAREPRGDRSLAKYRITPNPSYHATSRATGIFAKVRGFVWIDDQSGQLARVEGEVTDDISIGLFLGKVYKGSRFMQERFEYAPGLWFPTFTQYDFDGRKLFSSFALHERTFYSKYRRVGPPKQALEAIRRELAAPDGVLGE